jgi:transcriptional regulator with XRE-family HTH domain
VLKQDGIGVCNCTIDTGLVGKRIKAARKQKRITQELLAEKANCTHTHICNIENGKEGISLDLLYRISIILEKSIGSDEVLRFEVSGEKIQAIHMLPGYTHNIINLSDTDDLVTVMWANEQFDPAHPDTFFEPV